MYMGKTGTIWQFVCALFPSFSRTLSPDALFTRIRDTFKHPEFASWPHFQEHFPPKRLVFMANAKLPNAKLPNRPGFALLRCVLLPVIHYAHPVLTLHE